jgi:FKBP-type peptidyl-prolyl cis-trans isomerase FkpA
LRSASRFADNARRFAGVPATLKSPGVQYMKVSLRHSLTALAVTAAIGLGVSATASELATEKERVSYMVGMDVGRSLEQIKDELDLAVFSQAIEAVLSGKPTALTEEQALEVRQAFMQKLQAKQAAAQQEAAEKNKREGEAFLADNKKKKGVVTTASGLQYQVMTQGKGAKPAATDTVKVHYVGTLLDGTKFDSSYDRGQPAQFALNGVIPGWTEALQLMTEGSKYTLWLPSELAYGDRGTPGPIGPNATLKFEVELLEIVKQ